MVYIKCNRLVGCISLFAETIAVLHREGMIMHSEDATEESGFMSWLRAAYQLIVMIAIYATSSSLAIGTVYVLLMWLGILEP